MSKLASRVGPEAITGPGKLIIALPRECSPAEVLAAASKTGAQLDLLTIGRLDRGQARFMAARGSTAWTRFSLGPEGGIGIFIDVEKVADGCVRATIELGEDPWSPSSVKVMLHLVRRTFQAIREQLSASLIDFEPARR